MLACVCMHACTGQSLREGQHRTGPDGPAIRMQKERAHCAMCRLLVSTCMLSQTHPCALHAFANACARALCCKMPEHQRSLGPERACTRMHTNACERMRGMHACQRVRARSALCAMHARSMNSWLCCCAHVASMCSLSLSLPVFLLLSQWLQDPPQAARSGGQACARAQSFHVFTEAVIVLFWSLFLDSKHGTNTDSFNCIVLYCSISADLFFVLYCSVVPLRLNLIVL